MKIDFAIHSSNSNPYYLDFWPLVSKVWKVKFGIEPILLYVDDNHSIPIDETYGKVIKFKPVIGAPIDLQCLWIRYWWPSQISESVCILSDIDMFPISENYFVNNIKDISDDKYVHLNPQPNYFPSCYHIAKGKLYKDVLKLHDEWSDSVHFLYNLDIGYSHSFQPGKVSHAWGSDENYATQCINEYANKDIFVFISHKYNRIDRSCWVWNEKELLDDQYADSHSIRPYNDILNKSRVDILVNTILTEHGSN